MPDGPLRGGVVVIEARGLVVEKLPPLVVRRPFPVFFSRNRYTTKNGHLEVGPMDWNGQEEKETITEEQG